MVQVPRKRHFSFLYIVLGAIAAIGLALLVSPHPLYADTTTIDFEDPPYIVGNIDGQDGWSKTGGFDVAVVDNTYGHATFGDQSLRLSNAVVSGSFGDQTFSKSLVDEAGEASAVNNGLSGGTRQNYFSAEWEFASARPDTYQPNLSVVASPDRGDGARMSYVGMVDEEDGLTIRFYDYHRGIGGSCANGTTYILTDIATELDRTVPHTVKIEMWFVDGEYNDVVRVWVDGELAYTGTSWESYFRDCEGNPPRTVDSILFRAAGTAAPDSLGYGIVIDNLTLSSSTTSIPQCTTTCYVDATTGHDSFGGDAPTSAKKTIQAGVNQVSVNGTVIVAAGVYTESLVINKDGVTLQGAGAGTDPAQHTIITRPTGNTNPGISLPTAGTTDVTITNLRVQNFANGGICSIGANNNGFHVEGVQVANTTFGVNCLGGIYMNGPVNGVTITNNELIGNTSRGIVIWNGFKQNITITHNIVTGNNCCGIELQDGTASGVLISDNTVSGNADSGIAAVGLTSGAGPNVIANNTLTNNGRFGIEIKLPNGTGLEEGDGSIVVRNNTVQRTLPITETNPTEERDLGGIVVIRRGWVASSGNVDIPTGVVVKDNTVSGYVQSNPASVSDGFGIVIEGTNMLAYGNIVSGNDVGIQAQQGHLPYTANTNTDGNQLDLDDDHFGRGNSPIVEAVVNRNALVGNGIGFRTAGVATAVDGTCNWWGALSGPGSVGPGTGDPVSVNVTFNPWLGSSDLAGPCATPTVGFAAASAIVAENVAGGTLNLPVALSEPAGQIITVTYAAISGTATVSDYTLVGGNLVFNPGETSKLIAVGIVNDLLDEIDESFTVTLSSPIYATLAVTSSVVVTITDDDPMPQVQFSAANYTVPEPAVDSSTNVTVTLSAASSLPITASYTISAGTATDGSDFTASNGVLTFAPGSVTQTIAIPILSDLLDEIDETINLALGTTSATVLPGAITTATLTILDDDAPPTVQFSQAETAVGEADSQVTLTVTLSSPSGKTISVDATVVAGTATAGVDYTGVGEVQVFAPGETSQTLQFTIINDNLDETDETFAVTLSNPINTVLGTPISNTVTIVDNDPPPVVAFRAVSYAVNEGTSEAVIEVELNAPSGLPVSVSYATSPGSAQAAVDYITTVGVLTIPPGATIGSFVVPILDDTAVEENETINLQLSSPVNATLGNANSILTIFDDDEGPLVYFSSASYIASESDGSATITVVLSEPAPNALQVSYAVSGDPIPPGVLAFNLGELSKSFTIPIIDDTVADGDQLFTLTLTNPQGARLGATSQATLTILDNDITPTVQFDSASYFVNEHDGTVTITVILSEAVPVAVTVDYSTGDITDTADAGADYVATSGTLTFAPGDVSESFQITIIDDTVDEVDEETVGLSLLNPTRAILGGQSKATLTIIDNEGDPLVEFASATFEVDEDVAGGVATIQVTLNRPAPNFVSVKYATSDGSAVAGSDYTTVGSLLVFAPGETSKSFTVPILNDALHEATETILLTLSDPTNAILGGKRSVTLSILDDDPVPQASFSEGSFTATSNGGGVLSLTVVLSGPSGIAATVPYTANLGGGAAASLATSPQQEVIQGVWTFAPGEVEKTFTIVLTPAQVASSGDTVEIVLGGSDSVTPGSRPSITLSIDGSGLNQSVFLPLITR